MKTGLTELLVQTVFVAIFLAHHDGMSVVRFDSDRNRLFEVSGCADLSGEIWFTVKIEAPGNG